MGPCESECPKCDPRSADADGSSHTRCNGGLAAAKYAAARRARAAKPSPRAGQMIVFDEPLSFADGQSSSGSK